MRIAEKRRISSLFLPSWPVERLYRGLARQAAPLPVAERPRALARAGAGGIRLTACNALARATGVEPGQLVPDAMALCPKLEILPADPSGDRKALRRLAGWCGRWTPWTAADFIGMGGEPDGILLDITGCAHLFGGEAALLAEMRRRFAGFGFTARIAIASTPGAAWALSRFGNEDECVLPEGGEVDALRPLPVAALRLSADQVDGLIRLGLKRVGDLYGRPRAPLTARFGAELSRRLDEALGAAPEPISPARPPVPFRASLAFAEGLTRQAHILDAVTRITGDLCAVLARERKGARRMMLQLFRVDGEVTRLRAGTGIATHDAAHLARLFHEKLMLLGDDFDPGFGIEAIELACLAADPLAPAQSGFEGGDDHEEELEKFVDRVSNRFGADRLLRLAPRASHIPERAVMAVPALNGVTPAIEGWKTHLDEHRACLLGGSLPRPLRLLAAPEPVEAVAEVPEGPPLLFRWRRIAHRVARAEGPERITPEWWRGGGQHTRDYYRVEDGDGRRFWLYRDGLYRHDNEGPRWFLHGIFE
ncbi:DNA polymerase Y family protein [Parvibaculum sp.]|uniref:Y-family DNA polymerase n=1 Tax=Parvibaculum sp. TaxID=2024848 RepID=UPI00391C624C